jgi:hypothetical protein
MSPRGSPNRTARSSRRSGCRARPRSPPLPRLHCHCRSAPRGVAERAADIQVASALSGCRQRRISGPIRNRGYPFTSRCRHPSGGGRRSIPWSIRRPWRIRRHTVSAPARDDDDDNRRSGDRVDNQSGCVRMDADCRPMSQAIWHSSPLAPYQKIHDSGRLATQTPSQQYDPRVLYLCSE